MSNTAPTPRPAPRIKCYCCASSGAGGWKHLPTGTVPACLAHADEHFALVAR